jgi:hypothetical protein
VSGALYSTIWAALVLFVAAQHGQSRISSRRPSRLVAWTNAIGLTLCIIHIVLAMASVHGWSHAAAMDATARRTESVYGWRWAGGVYVNYLFVLVWALDAWLARSHRDRLFDAPAVRWPVRIFYAIVIFNAAVVFARGSMRVFGVVLVASLLLAWRKTSFQPSL